MGFISFKKVDILFLMIFIIMQVEFLFFFIEIFVANDSFNEVFYP